MPIIDALIQLDRLRCNRESDGDTGHSEPYIWSALYRIDDDTLRNGALVVFTDSPSPPLRVVVKPDMKAGETADIPVKRGMSSLSTRFRDGVERKNLIFVVALLELDDTPEAASTAGFVAFRSELRATLAKRLLELSLADKDQRDEIIEQIRSSVGDKVGIAIEDNLTTSQKLEIAIGARTLDDLVDTKFISFEQITNTDFTLAFESKDKTASYELDGHLSVTVNPCQSELDRVNIATHNISNIDGRIRQLHNAPESTANEAELSRLQAQLLAENAKLNTAKEAFQQCLMGGPAGLVQSRQTSD